jgi:hypothetical protein
MMFRIPKISSIMTKIIGMAIFLFTANTVLDTMTEMDGFNESIAGSSFEPAYNILFDNGAIIPMISLVFMVSIIMEFITYR